MYVDKELNDDCDALDAPDRVDYDNVIETLNDDSTVTYEENNGDYYDDDDDDDDDDDKD